MFLFGPLFAANAWSGRDLARLGVIVVTTSVVLPWFVTYRAYILIMAVIVLAGNECPVICVTPLGSG